MAKRDRERFYWTELMLDREAELFSRLFFDAQGDTRKINGVILFRLAQAYGLTVEAGALPSRPQQPSVVPVETPFRPVPSTPEPLLEDVDDDDERMNQNANQFPL